MKNQTKPTVPVTIPLEAELEQELRNFAASKRISRAELIRQIINKYWHTYKTVVLSMDDE